jgi:parallel beta-helix repeat protein
LTHDLVGCRGDGLVIGADGVTIDLAGHRIVAAASRRPTGCGDFGRGCGINDTGFDDVTVEHGAIRGFPDGVDVIDAGHVRLQGLRVQSGSGDGMFLSGVSRGLVKGNAIVHCGFRGVAVGDSAHVRVLGNHIRASFHTAVTLFRSDHSVVARNVISGAGGQGVAPADYGIEIGGSSDNVILRNTVRDNAFEGVLVVAGRLGDIAWLRSVGNVVAQNSISGAGRASATGIEVVTVPQGVVRRTRLRGNRVYRNGDIGILIDTAGGVAPRGTVLVRNVVTRNAPDGIDVEVPRTTLRLNRASRNRGLGIFAVAGVTDGGGNVAHGNGDPRECVNVVCG